MKQGILYLLGGRKHAGVLTVSLWSLRKLWQGPVTVVCSDADGLELGRKLQSDRRLAVDIQTLRCQRRRHASYVAKTKLHSLQLYERTVFLDADTIVTGAIDELWPRDTEVVLTHFSDWHSRGRIMRSRIQRWENVARSETQRMLVRSWPAINTGVVGFHRDSGFMPAWEEMCSRNPSFICDELAAQLIYPDHAVRLVDDRFNCSPIYGRHQSRAHVWHFHGRKHLHPGAVERWWPVFLECWHSNAGRIREWAPAGDRRLESFLRHTPALEGTAQVVSPETGPEDCGMHQR